MVGLHASRAAERSGATAESTAQDTDLTTDFTQGFTQGFTVGKIAFFACVNNFQYKSMYQIRIGLLLGHRKPKALLDRTSGRGGVAPGKTMMEKNRTWARAFKKKHDDVFINYHDSRRFIIINKRLQTKHPALGSGVAQHS